jgi:hypothetical protein
MVRLRCHTSSSSPLIPSDKHYSLDHKILIMQLLSRVMGSHKLCILGFYSYIIK